MNLNSKLKLVIYVMSRPSPQRIKLSHLSIADFRAEMHLPKLRPIRFCTHRYVVCIMGKKKKFQRDRRKKIAKVATGNRQNRHMAEFRESFEMKVVEHQILCGKLVSQA